MPKYRIEGRVNFRVDFSIEAESETDAIAKAKKDITSEYSFDAYGGLHSCNSQDIDVTADEEKDDSVNWTRNIAR